MSKNKTLKEATEKELAIALLEKRIERKTGKKVSYAESKALPKSKEEKIKVLEAAIEKATGKKVVYENEELTEYAGEGSIVGNLNPQEIAMVASGIAAVLGTAAAAAFGVNPVSKVMNFISSLTGKKASQTDLTAVQNQVAKSGKQINLTPKAAAPAQPEK